MNETIALLSIVGMFCILLGVSCMQNPYLKRPQVIKDILLVLGVVILLVGGSIVIFGGINGY